MEYCIYEVGDIIGSGRFRDTFQCKNDASKVLKFDKSPRVQNPLTDFSVSKRIRHAIAALVGVRKKQITGNVDEIQAWKIISEAGLSDKNIFTKVHGLVQTNRGTALLVDRVENFWDEDIKSVAQYIQAYGLIRDKELINAINCYFDLLRKYKVPCFADRPENMGIVLDRNNRIFIKCFDSKLYVNHSVNPFYHLDCISQKRTERRVEQHYNLVKSSFC